MEDGVKKRIKKDFTDRFFVVILVILGVMIIGLGAGVGVTLLNNRGVSVDEIVETCEGGETSTDVSNCIDEYYDSGEGKDLVVRAYEAIIDKVIKREDYMSAAKLISSRSLLFVDDGKCGLAMEMLNDFDDEKFDDTSKGVLYSYALSMSRSCNDVVTEEKYNNLLTNILGEDDAL